MLENESNFWSFVFHLRSKKTLPCFQLAKSVFNFRQKLMMINLIFENKMNLRNRVQSIRQSAKVQKSEIFDEFLEILAIKTCKISRKCSCRRICTSIWLPDRARQLCRKHRRVFRSRNISQSAFLHFSWSHALSHFEYLNFYGPFLSFNFTCDNRVMNRISNFGKTFVHSAAVLILEFLKASQKRRDVLRHQLGMRALGEFAATSLENSAKAV